MIDLTMNRENLKRTVERAKERNIIIPTFAEMQHPETIPEAIQNKLPEVGLWDVNPLNLFRITWKNNPVEKGGDGRFGDVNYDKVLGIADAVRVDRRESPHRNPRRQMVPHGLPQGRRFLRLPCPASRDRAVRSDVS